MKAFFGLLCSTSSTSHILHLKDKVSAKCARKTICPYIISWLLRASLITSWANIRTWKQLQTCCLSTHALYINNANYSHNLKTSVFIAICWSNAVFSNQSRSLIRVYDGGCTQLFLPFFKSILISNVTLISTCSDVNSGDDLVLYSLSASSCFFLTCSGSFSLWLFQKPQVYDGYQA